MVSGARSDPKRNGEVDVNVGRKNGLMVKVCQSVAGKADIRGVRSAREKSSPRDVSSSPQSMRVSRYVENGRLPSTLSVKGKSERFEEHTTLSPLRRSDKKENLSSSSSGSKYCLLSELKSNKEKRNKKLNSIQGNIESVGIKKKKMNGRIFKSLFKRQQIKKTIPDVDKELEGLDKLSHACSNRATSPKKLVSCERSSSSPVISKVKLDVGSYSTNTPMLGEAKVSSQWKHINGQCPRSQNRKRVQGSDGSPGKSVTEIDDVEKKRRKAVIENVDPYSVPVDLQGHQETEVTRSEGGLSRVLASRLSQSEQRDNVTSISNPNHISGGSSFDPDVDTCEAEERNSPSDEQKCLHSSLKGEIGRLCQILKLSEDVSCTMRRFLEYVILNHHMRRNSPAIIQAFQISLCWIAASILKQDIDKRKTLILAKQFLNYQCTEEQVHSVYSNMQHLKRIYLQCSLNTTDSCRDHMLAEEDINKDTINVNEGSLIASSVKMNIEENSTITEHDQGKILLQQIRAPKDNSSGSRMDNMISGLQKKCDKRMKKLIQKQEEEMQEFHQIWEEKKLNLEIDHKLESAVIRSIYGEGSARTDKLKLLDDKSAKTMEENNLLKEMHFKDLMVEQLAARSEEKRKAVHWLAEAKACCSSKLSAADGAQSLGSQVEEVASNSQSSRHILGAEGVVPLTTQHVEDKNLSRSVCLHGNDMTPSDTSVNATVKEVGSNTPTGTGSNLVNTNPPTLAVVEQLNQPEYFATVEINCANLSASGKRVPDERSDDLKKEVPESVPCETVDYVNPVKLSIASNKIGMPDAVVNERDGTDETPTGVLCLSRQILVSSEQTEDFPHPQNEVGVACPERSKLAVVERLNQPKHFATGEMIGVNLPVSGDKVPVKMRSVELNKEVPPEGPELVPGEIVDHVDPVELINVSNEEYDKGGTIDLPEALVKKRDGADETTTGLCLFEQSEQMEGSQHPKNEVEVESSKGSISMAEQLNKPTHFASGEVICMNLPASGDRVPDELRSVELDKEVPLEVPETVPYEIDDYVNPLELKNVSNEGYDKGDTIDLTDGFVNQRDGTDRTPNRLLLSARQILVPSEQAKDSSHHCDLLPLKVSEDQFQQSLSAELPEQGVKVVEKQNTLLFKVVALENVNTSTILQSNTEPHDRNVPVIESQSTLQIEVATLDLIDTETPEQSTLNLQDQDAPVLDYQGTQQIEVATLDLIDTETREQSTLKLQDQDAPVLDYQGTLQIEVRNSALVGTVTPVQSNVDGQLFEKCDQLHLVSIDVASSCNQSTAIEAESQIHDLGRNSSQTAEGAETEVLSRESARQLGENLEIQTNHFDIGSLSRVTHETRMELPASLHNNAPISQAVVGTIELLNQAVLPLGIDMGHLHRSSYPFSHPNHQFTSWNYPSLFVEPLQHEMETICKETEQLEKSHNDMVSQLRSDCEKEIQEIIAQIYNKYEVKLQAAEAEFRLKKNGLDKNHKKVFMNKVLAQTFNSKCLDLWSSALPGMDQGIQSSFMQHLCQLSQQHSVRLPPGVSACQPAPSLQIAGQTIRAMQQLSLSHSTRLLPLTCQNIDAPPLQSVRHAMALSGNMSTPTIANAIGPGNLHFPGMIRAPAPHLPTFRPAAASSMLPTALPLISQYSSQQQLP